MKSCKIVPFLAFALVSACAGTPQPSGPTSAPNELRTTLDRQVADILARHDVPSAAVAYLSQGEIQWTATYGERAPGEPATTDTLYNVASVTKALFAETMLRLAAEGELDLNAPMAPIFVDPDLAGDARAQLLTPALALSHRTGFAENWRESMPGGRLTIANEPGDSAFYSGENPTYLANYVEDLLGKRLEEMVAEEVLVPLGMTSTWFTPQPEWEGRVAMVRGRDGTMRLPDRSSQASPADDLHTTVDDFALLLRSAMHGEGLSPELVAARQTIYDDQVAQACPPGIIPPELCPEHTGFGLGWMVYDSGDNRFLLHNGKDWGERAIVLFEPEKQYGVAIFTSGANGRAVISEILQILVPDEKLNALVAAEARFDR